MQAVVLGQEDWLQLLLPHGQPQPCLCVWGGGSNTNPHYFKYNFFFKVTKVEILRKMTWKVSMPICEEGKKRDGGKKGRGHRTWVWLTGYELSFFISNFSGQFHLRGLDSIMGWPQFTFQKSLKLNVILSGKINNELSNLVQRSTNW